MLRLSAFSSLKAKRGGVFLHVELALLNNLRIVQDVPEDLDRLGNFLRRRSGRRTGQDIQTPSATHPGNHD